MAMVSLVFLVGAFICALLAAFNVSPVRPQLGWLSIALYFASILFGQLKF